MTALVPTRPALRYHGGKWLLAPWIIGHFPPHRIYVEPFGGAASVLIRKPRSYAEVYNDLDGEIVDYFRVLRDPGTAAALVRALSLTPFARAEFTAAYEPTDERVERARRLVVRSFMGFGSDGFNASVVTGFRAIGPPPARGGAAWRARVGDVADRPGARGAAGGRGRLDGEGVVTALAYYNEIDPYAAAWLRNLVAAGEIAPGEVDERDIRDVRPDELAGYAQCHFFAGIGVWSHALRRAGWSDDRPVWTGSCPCQPFSAAGRRDGFDDERHLWPALHHLVRECRPDVVLGEQVASADGLAWLDLVHADLEGEGYAVGAVDLCAAGVGAPHIRQRLFWVADAQHRRCQGRHTIGAWAGAGLPRGEAGGLGHADGDRRAAGGLPVRPGRPGEAAAVERRGGEAGGMGDTDSRREGAIGVFREGASAERGGSPGGVADADGEARGRAPRQPVGGDRHGALRGGQAEPGRRGSDGRPGPTNGFWGDADWIFCRDGTWRPVGPGAFPLAHGAHARVGRLRAYGNAIVAPAAVAFVEAVMAEIGS